MADLSFGSTAFPRAQEVRSILYGSGQRQGAQTARQAQLARRDDFYSGREYDHCEWSWDGYKADHVEAISPNVVVPYGNVQMQQGLTVRKKRPTMPERLTSTIVNRFTGMLFAEGRIPRVRVQGDADADDFLEAAFAAGRFWPAMIQARTYGGAMGSALVIAQLKAGAFSFSAISPRCVCDVIWADWDAKVPAGVLIQYSYSNERVVVTEGKASRTRGEEMIYRRIVDEELDITFAPAPLAKDGTMPELEVAEVHAHGLGRFPGAWVQNLPSAFEWDGVSDVEGQYQTFEGIDRQNAQTDKALLYNKDPTLVFGRDKKLDIQGRALHTIEKGSDHALDVGLGGHATYLEMSGSAITESREFCKERRQAALDAAQCILADPEKVSGSAQSAKAIEFLYAPMLEKTGWLRIQWGAGIEAVAKVVLDLGRAWSNPDRYSENVERVQFRLPPKIEEVPDQTDSSKTIAIVKQRSPGTGGAISLKWGAYFRETPADVQMKVSTWSTAYGSGLAPVDEAARAVAQALEVSDVDSYVAKVIAEVEARKQRSMEPIEDDYLAEASRRVAEQEPRFEELDRLEGEPAPEGDDVSEAARVSSVALNGAQVAAAKEIVVDVASGRIPRESGVMMLVNFFGLSPEAAESIMGEVGRSFVATTAPTE